MFCKIFLNIYSILREFITPNISQCRANKLLYRPKTGRKSNLITLWTCHVFNHHGWVRFQVSDRKLVNHTSVMILWSIILIVDILLWAFKDSTPLWICEYIQKDSIEKNIKQIIKFIKALCKLENIMKKNL